MSSTENNSANSVPPSGGWGATTIFSKSECLNHYTWGDGCHGWTFVDTDGLSVKQELMPPDTAEQLHYHEKATQLFFILKGRATFVIDGAEHALREQQGIQINPGQHHYIINKWDADLEFILYSYPSTKNDRVIP
ncbi:cupin domain-containing protein [Mucilaginibacter sp. UR6-1]|uniref:cupin domain-containing protein n=1 Tax=Mucilaginibacter sp. UR6-1 TaxID=1435643 RepID=UPI001E38B9B7|nr:cupin domain-containing protein [Mucilaginibacter sp. UR6-1]MCC8410241.1 cupin domain-containing protein [Mucilaginibacter sp. UR6-1]